MALGGAPFGEGEQLIFVEAFQRHGVDLDLEASLLCRCNPVEHLRQAAPAGDFGEFLGVQRVERRR